MLHRLLLSVSATSLLGRNKKAWERFSTDELVCIAGTCLQYRWLELGKVIDPKPYCKTSVHMSGIWQYELHARALGVFMRQPSWALASTRVVFLLTESTTGCAHCLIRCLRLSFLSRSWSSRDGCDSGLSVQQDGGVGAIEALNTGLAVQHEISGHGAVVGMGTMPWHLMD